MRSGHHQDKHENKCPGWLKLQPKICLEGSICGERCLLNTVPFHHTRSFLILPNLLLEEVCLSLKRDILHEVKGVGGFVELITAKFKKETVSNELDILDHQFVVHSDYSDRKGFSQELAFNLHSITDDLHDPSLAGLVHQVLEHQAGEVCVETFIP